MERLSRHWEWVRKERFIERIFIYALGLLFAAFGVTFAINSNLGVTPINSLPYILSLIFNIDVGICVAILFSIFVAMQIVILRKDFKIINLSQILVAFAFGYFMDFSIMIVGDFMLPTYAGRIAMLVISMMLIAIGLPLFLEMKLVNPPPEGIVLAIAQKIPGGTFHRVKIVFDCLVVALGIILSIIFLGGFYGIREGTVIGAIFIGRLIPVGRSIVAPILRKTGLMQREIVNAN